MYLVVMFHYAEKFNQDVRKWNVKNVTSTRFMFMNAFSFKNNLSSWDVTDLKAMEYMFRDIKTKYKRPRWYREKTEIQPNKPENQTVKRRARLPKSPALLYL